MPERPVFNPEAIPLPVDRVNDARKKAELQHLKPGEQLEQPLVETVGLAKLEVIMRYLERYPANPAAQGIRQEFERVTWIARRPLSNPAISNFLEGKSRPQALSDFVDASYALIQKEVTPEEFEALKAS